MKQIYTNGTDSVIAESEEDACRVWAKFAGEPYDYAESQPWVSVDQDQDFSIRFYVLEDEPFTDTEIPTNAIREKVENYPYNMRITAKAKDWAECNFPKFLCSTEY